MTRWAMVIDLDRCVACQACSAACRAENNVSFVGPEQAEMGRAIFWNEVIPQVEGEYPHVKARFVPRPCFHCDNPPCVKVCPVGATYKDEEGIVRQNYARCIGCRYCMVACPYGARYFNWYAPQWPDGLDRCINPDRVEGKGSVEGPSPRPKGIVEKCTFCLHRLPVPACNQACPANARYFGDLDDPDSVVSQLARSPRAFRFLEELGTEPKVYYLKEGP
ncbi:MAG: 4Fe-4S dicluster domain-containing protein [Anaerolineae bacterium]